MEEESPQQCRRICHNVQVGSSSGRSHDACLPAVSKSCLETRRWLSKPRQNPDSGEVWEQDQSADVAVLFFCRELRCVPDIWSLVEWSDWLTPRNMGRRYDTVFYLCCCETTPPISADGTEVVDARVCACVTVCSVCV